MVSRVRNGGVRNGPPYPLSRQKSYHGGKASGSKSTKVKVTQEDREKPYNKDEGKRLLNSMAKGALIGAGIFGAGLGAYALIKYKNVHADQIIKAGQIMSRVTSNGVESDLKDRAFIYVTKNAVDNEFFASNFHTVGTQINQFNSNQDIKIAGRDTCEKVWKEAIEDVENKYRSDIDGVREKQKEFLNNLNPTDKRLLELKIKFLTATGRFSDRLDDPDFYVYIDLKKGMTQDDKFRLDQLYLDYEKFDYDIAGIDNTISSIKRNFPTYNSFTRENNGLNYTAGNSFSARNNLLIGTSLANKLMEKDYGGVIDNFDSSNNFGYTPTILFNTNGANLSSKIENVVAKNASDIIKGHPAASEGASILRNMFDIEELKDSGFLTKSISEAALLGGSLGLSSTDKKIMKERAEKRVAKSSQSQP